MHARHGIRTEAWSPIGQGKGLLDAPEFAEIAQAHGKRRAGGAPLAHPARQHHLPEVGDPERIRENFEIFDFELSDDEMNTINNIGEGGAPGSRPRRVRPLSTPGLRAASRARPDARGPVTGERPARRCPGRAMRGGRCQPGGHADVQRQESPHVAR